MNAPQRCLFSWRRALTVLPFTLAMLVLGGASRLAAQDEAARDGSGAVWQVSEDGGWSGTWTQRGDSGVFDAVWHKGGQRVTGLLTVEIQGRRVRVQSRKQSNGSDVDYQGTLSADGRAVAGTLRVLGRAGLSNWKAKIRSGAVPISVGRVWHVTEDGGWTGTWTRRGASLVFDGVWHSSAGTVTGVLRMAVQGASVHIQSRKQSNGSDVDYQGTLSKDGRSIKGSLTVLGRRGSSSWKARIDP